MTNLAVLVLGDNALSFQALKTVGGEVQVGYNTSSALHASPRGCFLANSKINIVIQRAVIFSRNFSNFVA
jgi:hypothetical protein